MTTIVKAADAAQFLSVVPRMLGYTPRRSVVLIPFAHSRSRGAIRFDLPAEEDADRIAATFIGTVCRIPDADAVAAVVYTDEVFDTGMPQVGIARALMLRADTCGLRVTDALCVGEGGWGSYLDPECPPTGRPLTDLNTQELPSLGLPAVSAGDQRSGAELPPADPTRSELVTNALRSLGDAVRLVCGPDSAVDPAAGPDAVDSATGTDVDSGSDADATARTVAGVADVPSSGKTPDDAHTRVDPTALTAVCDLDDLPSLFEDALSWDAANLAPYRAATLLWCLQRPSLRDIALVQWCSGMDAGDVALDAQLRWEAGEEYPAQLAMHMWGEGPRPDPRRLEQALELVRNVAAAAPPSARAGALATCGWVSWALGRSTHAEQYAEQACELEPEHGLAEIVRSFVLAGHLPDWAFRPSEL